MVDSSGLEKQDAEHLSEHHEVISVGDVPPAALLNHPKVLLLHDPLLFSETDSLSSYGLAGSNFAS